MALTLNNFIGWETGGLEEADSIVNTPAIETTVVQTGTYSVKVLSGSVICNQFQGGTSDAGDSYILGWWVYVTAKPASAYNILRAESSGGSAQFRIRVETNGDVVLVDAGNSDLVTVGDPLTFAEWQFWEIRWSNSDTGTFSLWINNKPLMTGESGDLLGSAVFSRYRFSGSAQTPSAVFVDDIYMLSGSTSDDDRLGEVEVFKYQSVKASATPDDGGGDLNTGQWGDAGETPLDNVTDVAIYTTTGAGAVDSDSTNGSPEGPLNDLRIHGDSSIKGLKGVWNMKRGTGGGAAHYGLLGNDSDGTARSADFDPPASYGNFFHVTEASGGVAGDIPLSSEYCRIGFETTGAQDFNCGDMWAMLLHVPASITELGIQPPLWNPIARHMLVR